MPCRSPSPSESTSSSPNAVGIDLPEPRLSHWNGPPLDPAPPEASTASLASFRGSSGLFLLVLERRDQRRARLWSRRPGSGCSQTCRVILPPALVLPPPTMQSTMTMVAGARSTALKSIMPRLMHFLWLALGMGCIWLLLHGMGWVLTPALGSPRMEMPWEGGTDEPFLACPVCSARISKDLLDHITLQHGYLFKLQRHHRFRRVAVPSDHALSLAGRDLQETYLKVLHGNTSRSSGANTSSSVTDSLLSSLVLNLSSSEAEDTTKSSAPTMVENSLFKRSVPSKTWKTRPESNLSHEERERRRRRAVVKASFVQHLLVSTLFDD